MSIIKIEKEITPKQANLPSTNYAVENTNIVITFFGLRIFSKKISYAVE